MMLKKILSAVLALVSIATFAACASDTSGDAKSTSDTSANADTTVAETKELTNDEKYANVKSGIEPIDYEGYTFTIMDREESAWGTRDVFSESENGDPINDAVYQRNATLEELYNIKIAEKRELHQYSSNNPSMVLANLILANEDSVDLITDAIAYLGKSLAVPGLVLDLKEIEGINLDADHWDHMMEEGLSIAGRLYFTTGDISIMDNEGTWCVLFNKRILNEFSLDDPYTLVNDGTWTLSSMHEMAKTSTVDLNGDGEFNENDQWGLLSEQFNTYALWAGSGEKIIDKDANDDPLLTVYNERSVSAFQKVMDIQMDRASCITIDRLAALSPKDGVNTNSIFKDGNALFIYGGLWLVSQFRDSEVDFGILPCPKLEETQDSYYNSYSYANLTAYSIPMTVADVERTANIFESMAALSKYSLTPAYYDITLEGKFLRDEESSGMIDIILATRNFDLGTVFDFGGAFSMFSQLYQANSSDMASKYAGLESIAQKAIDDFVKNIAD